MKKHTFSVTQGTHCDFQRIMWKDTFYWPFFGEIPIFTKFIFHVKFYEKSLLIITYIETLRFFWDTFRWKINVWLSSL